jgi:hypothetical protein
MPSRKNINTVFLIFIVFAGLIVFNFSIINNDNFTKAISNDQHDKWTIMLYFCADSRNEVVGSTLDNSGNFVHAKLWNVLNSMVLNNEIYYGSIDELNIIVLYDYPYSSSHPKGEAKIYQVNPASYTEKANWGPTNMGETNTLRNFISYCKTNYQADNYALVLSDHGRAYSGFCFDYHATPPGYTSVLGDCLTPTEVEIAINDNNGVEILVLDTCLGGSFEVAWQLRNCVDYMIGSETSQSATALHHPREFLWHLSRNISMSSVEFAECCYNTAINPTKVLPAHNYAWLTATLFDLTCFDNPITTELFGTTTLEQLFDDFTQTLLNELLANLTRGRELFLDIRNSTTANLYGLHSKESMLTDTYLIIDEISKHGPDFLNSTLADYATELKVHLNPTDGVIKKYSGYSLMKGASICFPNNPDMYHGFLFPTIFNGSSYDALGISAQTSWGLFLKYLFQDPPEMLPDYKLPEQYCDIFLRVDPTVKLHVNYWFDPDLPPMHIGLNEELIDEPGMGIEIGIPEGHYYNDFFGNNFIRVPYDNLPAQQFSRADEKVIEIVVDSSSAASAEFPIYLMVKNIVNGEIDWFQEQEIPNELGQVFVCDVSSDNILTELEPVDEPTEEPPPTEEPTTTEEPPTETNTSSSDVGFNNLLLFSSSLLTITLVISVIIRQKKKK